MKIYNFLNPNNDENYVPNNYTIFGLILLHLAIFLSIFIFPRELLIESYQITATVLFLIILAQSYLFYCFFTSKFLEKELEETPINTVIVFFYLTMLAAYFAFAFILLLNILKVFGISFLIGVLIAIAIFLFYKGIQK